MFPKISAMSQENVETQNMGCYTPLRPWESEKLKCKSSKIYTKATTQVYIFNAAPIKTQELCFVWKNIKVYNFKGHVEVLTGWLSG